MTTPEPTPHWLLRRSDQAAVAALAVVALAGTLGWWACAGGWRGRLVEIDRAEPREARFEIDINTADRVEWTLLPGIGPKLAGRILDSRKESGPFADVEDLRRVSGIGPKKLERIRPYLRPVTIEETKMNSDAAPR